jgi:hypothetical protein
MWLYRREKYDGKNASVWHIDLPEKKIKVRRQSIFFRFPCIEDEFLFSELPDHDSLRETFSFLPQDRGE